MSRSVNLSADTDLVDLLVTLDHARHTLRTPDPVLATLTQLAAERDRTNQRIRAVLAYARTAVHPRPYRLADLADALGISISGVRTAYDQHDAHTVSQALHRPPPPATRPAVDVKPTNDVDTSNTPLLDVGGYLACGCHGTQRDHTCIPFK